MLTKEDQMIFRRLPVEAHSRLLSADRRDARIMSDHVKLSSRGHDLHRSYKRWVGSRGRA